MLPLTPLALLERITVSRGVLSSEKRQKPDEKTNFYNFKGKGELEITGSLMNNNNINKNNKSSHSLNFIRGCLVTRYH